MTPRTKIREAITRRLVPELKRRGFEGPDKISGNALIHEYSRRSDHGIAHLRIQFDKRQRPCFIFSVYVEPPEGIEGLVKKEGHLLQGCVRSRGNLGLGGWFRADRPWWQRLLGLRSTREEEAVTEAIERLDAIEDWFAEPRQTEAVRTFLIHYRNPERKNA